EALFGTNGKLYATFGAFTVNSTTITVGTVLIPGRLYQIDPTTGATTVIGPTDLNIGAVADVNGTFYAFDVAASQILRLDLTNGNTSFVADFDPAAGLITGAVPTPEPFSFTLTGVGICFLAVCRLKKRGQNPNRI